MFQMQAAGRELLCIGSNQSQLLKKSRIFGVTEDDVAKSKFHADLFLSALQCYTLVRYENISFSMAYCYS